MIIFIHLLNDHSGSPRVLTSAIFALTADINDSYLLVGSDGGGCLDNLNVTTLKYWYRRMPYRALTLLTYLLSQFALFFLLVRMQGIRRDAIIYINTLLPFGAALYGWVTKRPVIYHLHEVSLRPLLLKWFLINVARHTASKLIYVSNYHRTSLPITGVPVETVHNALDTAFLNEANLNYYKHRHGGCFNVLMLASLRDHKGVPEFLALASSLQMFTDIHFDLVANDDGSITRYFERKKVPSNVTIHSSKLNTAPYYAKASLVLNLSRPDKSVETFGLTLLEAMAFGIPVIAPPVGGPEEIVSHGIDGFLIDCRNSDELSSKVLQLSKDESLCLNLSDAARQKASKFNPEKFAFGIRSALGLI